MTTRPPNPAGQSQLEGLGRQRRAGLTAVPRAGHQDGQGRQGAHQHGVDQDLEHAIHALPHGMVRDRGRMDEWRTPETRFVGEESASHAVPERQRDRCPGEAARGRRARHRTLEDHPDRVGHLAEVHQDDQQTASEVHDTHERHQHLRDLADPFDATENDRAGQQYEADAGDHRRHTEAHFHALRE